MLATLVTQIAHRRRSLTVVARHSRGRATLDLALQ
jgi:hypothetical protein